MLSVATVLAVVNQKLREFKVALPTENGAYCPSGVGFRHAAADEDDDSPIVELRRFPVGPNALASGPGGPSPPQHFVNSSGAIYKPTRHRWHRCGGSRRFGSTSSSSGGGSSKRYIYRKLGQNLDKAELLIYLLLSGVNAIICLFVLPATGQMPTPDGDMP